MGQKWIVNTESKKRSFIEFVEKAFCEKKWVEYEINFDKTRTSSQNRALHAYCRLLAERLNDAGYPFIATINGKEIEVDWDKDLVKKFIWKPVQKIMTEKKSTTEPSTKQYAEVYETVNRFTASRFAVSVQWPSKG